MRISLVVFVVLLQGCSLLMTGDTKDVEVMVMEHITVKESRCQWSYGEATVLITEEGIKDTLCGNYGKVGDRVIMMMVENHKDKSRNGLKIAEGTFDSLRLNRERLK